MTDLLNSVESVLQQGVGLLAKVDHELYRRKDSADGSSLGAHYRHVLDHFSCVLEGIPTGQINYDQRRRNPEIENSVTAALLATEDLIRRFAVFSTETLRKQCLVIYSVGYGAETDQAVASNVAREVAFCVGHAIHHYAILKLLCAAKAVELPYEFGMAPSTLKHLHAQSAH
jgi:hypothetical protein